jgi:GTP cyclohydrolase II
MFTYIDPTIRERLVASGKLVRIDREGAVLGEEQAADGRGTISILGPIPLPLAFGEKHYDVQWYACVRNTELSKIEDIAEKLRAQAAQESFASLASSMAVNSVLIIGDADTWTNPLVRVRNVDLYVGA